jgi:hypothetical protein
MGLAMIIAGAVALGAGFAGRSAIGERSVFVVIGGVFLMGAGFGLS